MSRGKNDGGACLTLLLAFLETNSRTSGVKAIWTVKLNTVCAVPVSVLHGESLGLVSRNNADRDLFHDLLVQTKR